MACKIREDIIEKAHLWDELWRSKDWSAPMRERQAAGYIVEAILDGRVCESDTALDGMRKKRKSQRKQPKKRLNRKRG